MGILPGLFLFKQPSYLVNPLPPPTDHRRFIIKATRSATSEDSRKDSHGVSSRLPLLLFPTIATLPIEPMSAGEGESSTARTPRHRCVCIFRTIRSRLQGVRSVDHSHEKPLTSRYSERPFHAFQRTFSDPLTVRCVRFRLGVALRYVTLRYVLFPVATVDRRYREKKIVCRKRERRSRQRVAVFPRHGDQTRLVLRWVKVIPLVAESEINATHRRDWLPNARRNMQMSRPARASSKRGREWKIPTFFLSLSLSLSLSFRLALSRLARVAFRFVLSRISRAGPASIAARGRSEEQRPWRNETKKEEPMRRYNATPYVFLLLFDFFSLPVSPSYTPTLPTDK